MQVAAEADQQGQAVMQHLLPEVMVALELRLLYPVHP
jgi:hypothetical protein